MPGSRKSAGIECTSARRKLALILGFQPELPEKHGMHGAMSRKANWRGNATAESAVNRLKIEWVHGTNVL